LTKRRKVTFDLLLGESFLNGVEKVWDNLRCLFKHFLFFLISLLSDLENETKELFDPFEVWVKNFVKYLNHQSSFFNLCIRISLIYFLLSESKFLSPVKGIKKKKFFSCLRKV